MWRYKIRLTIMKVFLLVYIIYLSQFLSSAEKYLIDTPGCRIPKYELPIPDQLTKSSCGKRKVFVRKIKDTIVFSFKNQLKKCCYQNIYSSRNFNDVRYSKCEPIVNGSKIVLQGDFISVKCTGYEDVYAFTKKLNNTARRKKEPHWNVLLLGIDRISRTRAYHSLKSTVKFLQQENWLDFRGYNKAADDTYPNLVQVLTGKNVSTFEESCHPSMTECNNLMIWSAFKKAGYITAYGENALYMPDTFNGYTEMPTDHFMRPLFIASEKKQHGLICSKNIPSGEQVLTYVKDFVNTYRYKKYFGFFWIRSFSHDADQPLKNYDSILKNVLKTLANLKNTFVIFFSGHGMRYGKQKKYVESFYEDRLPMLFIKVPKYFKEVFPKLFSNLETNQRRLTSPKDLHLTLRNLLYNKNVFDPASQKLDGCPNCRSLFQFIAENRTCSDIGISESFCACHDLQKAPLNDYGAMHALIQLILKVQNTALNAPTTKCKLCAALSFQDVIRLHYFKHNNSIYYVIAIKMIPKKTWFEGIVWKNKDDEYEILSPIFAINKWRSDGNCALNNWDRAYCVCVKDPICRNPLLKRKQLRKENKEKHKVLNQILKYTLE